MNEQLQHWVSKAKESGLSEQDIHTMLYKQGWSPDEVKAIKPVKDKVSWSKIAIKILFSLILAALVVSFIFLVPIKHTQITQNEASPLEFDHGTGELIVRKTEITTSTYIFGAPFNFREVTADTCADKGNEIRHQESFLHNFIPAAHAQIDLYETVECYDKKLITETINYIVLGVDFAIFLAIFLSVVFLKKWFKIIPAALLVIGIYMFFSSNFFIEIFGYSDLGAIKHLDAMPYMLFTSF